MTCLIFLIDWIEIVLIARIFGFLKKLLHFGIRAAGVNGSKDMKVTVLFSLLICCKQCVECLPLFWMVVSRVDQYRFIDKIKSLETLPMSSIIQVEEGDDDTALDTVTYVAAPVTLKNFVFIVKILSEKVFQTITS